MILIVSYFPRIPTQAYVYGALIANYSVDADDISELNAPLVEWTLSRELNKRHVSMSKTTDASPKKAPWPSKSAHPVLPDPPPLCIESKAVRSKRFMFESALLQT